MGDTCPRMVNWLKCFEQKETSMARTKKRSHKRAKR